MDNNFLKNSIKEQILKRIRNKDLQMKPKLLFILKTALFVFGIILFFCFSAFVLSFIMFRVRATGIWYAPGFGSRGIGIFFAGFPWFLLIFILILIVVLEILAKKFSWVYKKPLIYSILGIAVFVFLMGFVFSQTNMHPQLFKGVIEGRMPMMEPFYQMHSEQTPPDLHIGEISAISDEEIEIKNEEGEVLTAIISDETIFPIDEEIEEGDLIMVIGKEKDSSINAFGIRKIEKDRENFFPQFGNRNKLNNRPRLK